VGAEAVNAIQPEASATIDFRLVPNQTPQRIRSLVEDHIRKQGFTIVHERPSPEMRLAHARLVQLAWADGYAAARTPIEHPFARSIVTIVERASGQKPLVVPTFGGSLPLYLFERTLRAPFVIVPTVNSDNNQHAADENVRLQNVWDAIEIFAAIYREP
jgi:acetylornithine deacetylase/succinyl-diaminopimelate desuccinylase-like protein